MRIKVNVPNVCWQKKFQKMQGGRLFLFCLSMSSLVVYGEIVSFLRCQDTAMLSPKLGTVHHFFGWLFCMLFVGTNCEIFAPLPMEHCSKTIGTNTDISATDRGSLWFLLFNLRHPFFKLNHYEM